MVWDLAPFVLDAREHPILWRLYMRLAIRHAVQHADTIIVPSKSTENTLNALFPIAREKTKVVYAGLDQEFLVDVGEHTLEVARRELNVPDEFILFVGTLCARKNVAGLLRAFEKVASRPGDNHYLVLRGGRGWGYQEIARIIEQSAYRHRIVWLKETLSLAQLHALYMLAKLFVLPSLCEGFGLPVLQAMASGVPVITSNVSSLPEITGGAALTVNPMDIEELTEAMVRVLDNWQLAEELREAGKQRAQEFSWQRTTREIVKILSTL